MNTGTTAGCRVIGESIVTTTTTMAEAGVGGIAGVNNGTLLACYSAAKEVILQGGGANFGGVIGNAGVTGAGSYLFWVHEPPTYNAPSYALGSDNNWGGDAAIVGYNDWAPFTSTGNFQYRYMGGLYPNPATATLAATLNAGLATLTPAVGYEFTAADGTNLPGLAKK